MAENSAIEWCDHTWTVIAGCDAISPACAHCYAALMAARLEAMGHEKYAGLATRQGNIGKWTGKVNLSEPDLVKPLQVKKPGRWFLTSMGDVGHDKVPFGFLDRIFAVMAWMPRHTYYVLTKRPARLGLYLLADRRVWNVFGAIRRDIDNEYRENSRFYEDETPFPWPLPNVVIGCTVEDQERADERNPYMRDIAAAGWRTFVSYEPALGPVDWSDWGFLSWLISGGESGQKARPSHPDWHRAARDFCAARGIPYLFKQWGEHRPTVEGEKWTPRALGGTGTIFTQDGQTMQRVGKKHAGRLLDGRTWDEMPKVTP